MRKMRRTPEGLLFALLFLAGCTPLLMPLKNPPAQAIKSGPNLEQVEKAIRSGATSAGWLITSRQPGRMTAEYRIRRHSVTVDIRFSEQEYRISYRESDFMKYHCTYQVVEPRISSPETRCPEGAPPRFIHRRYLVWVDELNRRIQVALANAS